MMVLLFFRRSFMHVPHGVYSKERVSMSWLKLWHALQKVLLCSSVSCFDFFRAHCKHSNLKQRKEPEESNPKWQSLL